MKTQKELKPILEKHLGYVPLIYVGGLKLVRKRIEDGNFLLDKYDVEKLAQRKDILDLLKEKSKFDKTSGWCIVCVFLLKNYPKSEKVLDAVLEAVINGSKIDEQGYWAYNVVTRLIRDYQNNEKMIDKVLEAMLNGSKLQQSYDWASYVANVFLLHYPHVKKIIEKVFQALVNASETKSKDKWKIYVADNFLKNSNITDEQEEIIDELYYL